MIYDFPANWWPVCLPLCNIDLFVWCVRGPDYWHQDTNMTSPQTHKKMSTSTKMSSPHPAHYTPSTIYGQRGNHGRKYSFIFGFFSWTTCLFWYLFQYFINKSVCLYQARWETVYSCDPSGIILCMGPANERRRYNVTSSPIGWAHTQNDPWPSIGITSGWPCVASLCPPL